MLSDALNIYLYLPFPIAILSLSSFRPGAAGSVTRTFGLFYTISLFVVAYFDVLSVLGSLLWSCSVSLRLDGSQITVLILIFKIMLISRARHSTLAEFVLAFSWHFLKSL